MDRDSRRGGDNKMKYTYDTELLSDLYKDAYGFRPDAEYFKAWKEYPDDFKQVIWNRILVDLAAAVEADKEDNYND
jgi:hypothetical protein